MKQTGILNIKVEDKTIMWFENSNEYIVLENTTAAILNKIHLGVATSIIAESLVNTLDVPMDKAVDFILDIEKSIYKPKSILKKTALHELKGIQKPTTYAYEKFYKINNIIFKICFLSETELSLVHPKFAHLVIEDTSVFNFTFNVFINNNYIFLYVDEHFIGSWSNAEIHYFQGKFSMELIQKIHQKEEEEWLGVFHASAISNAEKAMLFLGDSGNGKSTSLALLQANGFTCLADDFVPIDAKNQEVYSFPAAISIKKSSLETLLPIYPELETSAEYNFKRLNKIVRYLKPNNRNFFAHLPCNDLVFIKYEKDAKLSFTKISKIDAFQQLIPDSWISPKKENAEKFLNWFQNLTCYQLTYSKNDEMIETVKNLFNNDL